MARRIGFALLGGGGAIGAYFLLKGKSNSTAPQRLNLELTTSASLQPQDRPPLFKFDAFAACRGKVLGRSKVDTSYRGAPFSDFDCGEDAFIVTDNLLAVADGVGGWRSKGVDPAHFANALMSFTIAKARPARPTGSATPKQLLTEGYDALVKSKSVEAGSSTAALAGLVTNKAGQPRLVTANLGDSGIVVVRDGAVVFRAKQTQHSFNFPYQLQVPVRKESDTPSDAVAEVFAVRTGDLVVVGSDGLFDNLFEEEVAAVAHSGDAKVNAKSFSNTLAAAVAKGGVSAARPGESVDAKNVVNTLAVSPSTPPAVAKAIGPGVGVDVSAASVLARAREAASSPTAVVPFGVEASKHSRRRAEAGGKMDDITVVVGRVVAIDS